MFRCSHRKNVSLLLLFIALVMVLGTYSFDSKWVAHELAHDRDVVIASVDHQHESLGDASSASLSDAEHELLHALGHFDVVAGLTVKLLDEPSIQTFHLTSSFPLLPAELDSSFHPPRTTSLI